MQLVPHLRSTFRFVLLSFAALCLGACGSSGSSGSGSSSSGVEVNFTLDQVTVGETGLVVATVILTEAQTEDVSLNFVSLSPPFPTPTATNNLDFQVITQSPLLIPAGNVSANISTVILLDTLGELDEAFVLRLSPSGGVDIGPNDSFLVTILDDDAIAFPEAEPNDPEAMANDVGPIGVEIAYQITGTIDAAAVDFFRLTSAAATDVWIELIPLTTGPDVVLTIRDVAGTMDLAGPVNAGGPGESESLTYSSGAGESFLIEVANTFTGGMYRMKVVGLTPSNPLAPPTERTRGWAWIIDTETGVWYGVRTTPPRFPPHR